MFRNPTVPRQNAVNYSVILRENIHIPFNFSCANYSYYAEFLAKLFSMIMPHCILELLLVRRYSEKSNRMWGDSLSLKDLSLF